ncbi:uncharacterized protein J8A68_000420 [[Candida] subhashii]|uniref:GOLD domain-containing protein n=1 Tax=[Candida] subhashii TaxID=561895 RepID=A0A8J5V1V5_9ASCO|nr:uncharacterized protein J8A68_000420 [[Candida] subhashii]KAG7665990.1 hypothetical protein J8A68_000420 [[Candida] subhashii]
MKSSYNIYKRFILLFLFMIHSVNCIGLTIPPIKDGHKKQLSSINNLENCVSYQTNVQDIILISIKSNEKITSQLLNLNIFDNLGNQLRKQKNIGSREIDLIITNVDNKLSSTPKDKRDESAKSIINIFELTVEVKQNIKTTDYNLYKKYFSNNKKGKQQQEEEEFTQESFDNSVGSVKQELKNIVENLHSSQSILQELMEVEYKLRDTNEEIYSDYTLIRIIIISCIILFGLTQVVYIKSYLKNKNLL